MANNKNLIPLTERTKKEQREIAKMGGIKSGEVRRQKKTLKELLEIALSIKDDFSGEELKLEMVKALINKAIRGDVRAFEVIRDTIGEKPLNKQEVTNTTPQIIVATERDKQALEEIMTLNPMQNL
jgi:hypothetical protein